MSKAIFFSTGGVYTPSMLGMLSALLKKYNVNMNDISAVGGISSGAMIASFLATSNDTRGTIDNVLNILKQNSNGKAISAHYSWLNNLISLFTQESIFDDKGIDQVLFENLKDKKLETDLYIGYTNETDMEYVRRKFVKNTIDSNLHKFVHASMSIPVIFKGINDGGKRLSDGGLFHTLPTEQLRDYVYDCMEKKIYEAEVHLISASPYKFSPPKIVSEGFARPIRETIRLTKSLHNITMHNDKLWLDLFVENCLLRGFNLVIHEHMFPAKLMEIIDKKIPFEKYNKIHEDEIVRLYNIGEEVINDKDKLLHEKLNF